MNLEKQIMADKNGRVLEVGDVVTDGIRTGTVVLVSEVMAVKFEHKGKLQYTFARKLNNSEIEVVCSS